MRNPINMIEINLQKLERGTRQGMVTVHRAGKVFQRKQRVGQKEPELKPKVVTKKISELSGGMSNVDYALKHGWYAPKSVFFGSYIDDNAVAVMEDDKVTTLHMTSIDKDKNTLHIGMLEVNPTMRRQGKGVMVMREIVGDAIKSGVGGIELESMDENSDKFYDAIGMTNRGKIVMSTYTGDREWMEKFVEATK